MSKCHLILTYNYIYLSSGARDLRLLFGMHTEGVKQMNHMDRRINWRNFHVNKCKQCKQIVSTI